MAYYCGGHFPGPFGRTLVYYAEAQERARRDSMSDIVKVVSDAIALSIDPAFLRARDGGPL